MSNAAAQLPPGFPAMSIEQAHKLLVSAPASPFELEEREIRGVKIKTWKNAPPSLAAVFELSRPFAERVYMVNEDERVTFDAHRRAVAKFAQQLIADGVKKGDRVAIIMRNLPEWSVAFWGAVHTGAIVTPLNAWWTGPELEYGLTDSGTMIAIADGERWERLREHVDNCPALKRVYVSRSTEEITDPRVGKLEDVIGGPKSWATMAQVDLPSVPLGPEDDSTIFYTSGTTGKPKGAVITHRNVISNFFNAMCAQARSFLRRGEPLPTPIRRSRRRTSSRCRSSMRPAALR
jgi:long-chain acyl-CoA synthetase